MLLIRPNFRKFLQSCEGAVTVDYVVLTAAMTGLALASSELVIDGYKSLSVTVTGELSGSAQGASGPGISYADGFDNGAKGWFGAYASEVNGIGNVLGPIAGTNGAIGVSREFQFVEGIEQATIQFDLLAMDSLDNESGIIYISGREVGRLTKDHSGTTFTPSEVDGITISADIIDDGTQLGGNMGTQDWWKDARARISITVDSPDEFTSFGFGSTANQDVGDESFSIDNFSVTGLHDPDAVTTVTEEPV